MSGRCKGHNEKQNILRAGNDLVRHVLPKSGPEGLESQVSQTLAYSNFYRIIKYIYLFLLYITSMYFQYSCFKYSLNIHATGTDQDGHIPRKKNFRNRRIV